MSELAQRPWFYYIANPGMRVIFRFLLRVNLRGLENIPRQGPVIIAISHSSFLDPLVACAYASRIVIPMAKAEVFEQPVIGFVLRLYGAFSVRRGQVDVTAVKMALKILQNQLMLIIAPEGHRSETGSLQQGREGAIILALRSGAPIMPVAVWGGKAFWKNLARLRRTEINYFVGKPVLPAEMKPTRDQVNGMSHELMLRIAEMMPRELHGYYTDWAGPQSGYLKAFDAAAVMPIKEVANVS